MKNLASSIVLFCLLGFITQRSNAQTCEADLIRYLNEFKASCEPCASFYIGYDFIHNNSDSMMYGCDTTACNGSGEPTGYYYTLQSCPSQKTVAEDPNYRRQSVNCGSIVNTESQQLRESIPLVGTDFALEYSSGWSAIYRPNFKLAMSAVKSDFPSSITQVNISVSSTDGVYSSQVYYPSGVDEQFVFDWNGLDHLGNAVNGTKTFAVHAVQVSAGVSVPSHSTVILGGFRAKSLGLGGWVPSSFVFYDINSKRIYKSDGSVRTVQAQPWGTGQFLVPEEDASLAYVFNGDGNLKFVKSGLLGTTLSTFTYDTNGRLTAIADAFGGVTTFSRNSAGELTGVVAPKGQVTSIGLDSNGYLSVITNPNNEAYQMSYYGSDGGLATFRKPGMQVNSFVYDADGYLIKDSHSGGYFFDLVRSINGLNNEVALNSSMGRHKFYSSTGTIDSRSYYSIGWGGVQSYSSYSINPYQIYETDYKNGISINTTSSKDERWSEGAYFPSSTYVQYSYASYSVNKTQSVSLNDVQDPFSISSLSYQTQKDNLTINSLFNPATREWTNTTGLGRVSKVGIDSFERIILLKNGNLNSTTFSYTGKDLTQINLGTRQFNLGYNAATGFLSSVTDPLSRTYSYLYDNAGRLVSNILPDLSVISYSYDANGNLASVSPPGRPAHLLSYNASELMSSYEPPLLGGLSYATNYSYNSDKQLTSLNRPDGKTINLYYNAVSGVLESYDTPEGVYSQTIDSSSGWPASITTPSGIVTNIEYVGSKLGATYNYLNGNLLWSYGPSISSSGLIQSDTVTNPTGSTSLINYLYDDDSFLKKAGDVNLTYSYPNGTLSGTSMGSGTTGFTDTYTYNTYGEVTGYQAKRGTTTIYDLTLTRDGSGRISGKSQTMNALTDSFVYTFDDTGRLTKTDKNSVTVANYSYDSNSNRTGGNIGAQITTATYDAQDRMNTYNTFTYAYNANGDLTSKTNSTTSQTTTYTYDVFGNLRQVNVPPSTIITYEVDGLNRRISKKVNGTVQKRWVYMDQYRIAAELNASGGITKRFVYGSKKNIPDYMIASGVKYRIISDHLGSPRLVVKQSDGSITQRMNHDEFGRVTEDTNPGYLPFGFAGGVYDNQTGLVRFGARDFDPEVGRWTSKDPILFNGGDTNLYGYTQNDPVNWIDVTGATKTKPGQVLENDPLAGGGGGPAGSIGGSIGSSGSGGGSCPISGYTRHGINSAISRADGGSMSPKVILNTVNSPTSVAPNPGGGVIYSGPGGQVILNPNGQVITVIPSGSGSFRGNGGTP